MTQEELESATTQPTSSAKAVLCRANRARDVLLCASVIAMLVVLRLPINLHQPGIQDEQFFAVPGLTVLREGVPRIPYLPTRNRSTFFENADRCLMALPPGLFYVQAPFFAVFKAGYPTARIPCLLAGCLLLVVVYCMARQWQLRPWTAWFVVLLLAFSRPLMFSTTVARPDLLCVLCGVATTMVLFRKPKISVRASAIAGALCGLGALFHPFALVFAIQCGVLLICDQDSIRKRFLKLLLLSVCSLAVLCLWVPLISGYPEEFRSQFFANVFDRAGPGLPSRLIWPWAALAHHAVLLYEHAGPLQFGLLGIAAYTVVWLRLRSGQSLWQSNRLAAWLLSSIYLTAVVAGLHPTKGYWLYPASLLLIALGAAIEHLHSPRMVKYCLMAACFFLLIPGAGIRSTWTYLWHYGDPKYDGSRFIAEVLNKLPEEGLYLADLSYVFDVYLTGRDTLLCQEREQYWGDDPIDYAYILLAWEGTDAHWAEQYDAVLLKSEGNRATPQSCYIDIYVSKEREE